MAIVCQEMACAWERSRTAATASSCSSDSGHVWGWFSAGDLIVTNLVTLIAEFVAIRVGLAYFHLGAGVAAALGVVLVVFTIAAGATGAGSGSCSGWRSSTGCSCSRRSCRAPLGLGRALAADGLAVPRRELNTLLLLVASTIGATVTPWMIFFQQSASADKGLTPRTWVTVARHDRRWGACRDLRMRRADRRSRALRSRRIEHPGAGRRGIPRCAEARCRATRSATVFALGLIEAGAVAILTISASTGYAVGECLGVAHSFNNSTAQGAAVLWRQHRRGADRGGDHPDPRAPLLSIALNANVLATVLLPVALVFLIMLANDRELMGKWANKRATNRSRSRSSPSSRSAARPTESTRSFKRST